MNYLHVCSSYGGEERKIYLNIIRQFAVAKEFMSCFCIHNNIFEIFLCQRKVMHSTCAVILSVFLQPITI